ncbi:MAG: DUF4810 domain-containing protein [Betaproteobacteria bacterium HGW-Betaproteobacteria-4]|jgi:hypothetical protein|nr:MAG: DUF4810 domain-containing protein [Betaproteobacteria bacterium HGW-Betaproteobacteria-4]
MNILPKQARLFGLLILSTILLAGCVSRPQPLYYWGDYQAQVYGHFKGEKGPEEQIAALEAVREEALAEGKALPPGFQAHLAMLYGQTGRSERLVEQLEAEKKQFPESATFMDFLLRKFSPQVDAKVSQ